MRYMSQSNSVKDDTKQTSLKLGNWKKGKPVSRKLTTAAKAKGQTKLGAYKWKPKGYRKKGEKQKGYPRDWHKYDAYQENCKPMSLGILNDAVNSMNNDERDEYCGNGRPPIGTDNMLKLANAKVLGCRGLRESNFEFRFMKAMGYITTKRVPHRSSIANYMNSPQFTIQLRKLFDIITQQFAGIDSYAISCDSTGFADFGHNWLSVREDWENHNSRNKIHAMVGTKSNAILAVEITPANVSDTNMFASLLRDAFRVTPAKKVLGDSAYTNIDCAAAVAAAGAEPIFRLKKNTKLVTNRTTGRWRVTQPYDGMVRKGLEQPVEYNADLGLRNHNESVHSSMKRKLNPSIRSRKPVSQENELLAKTICYNIGMLVRCHFEFGLQIDFSPKRRKGF
jgi:hypothetical protein